MALVLDLPIQSKIEIAGRNADECSCAMVGLCSRLLGLSEKRCGRRMTGGCGRPRRRYKVGRRYRSSRT